jgi:acyl-CoA reductase-like NAD-dependent aldehyde dehydrogenase
VAAFVEDAVAKGAKLEARRHGAERQGFFYPPTVLSNVPETPTASMTRSSAPSPRSRPSPMKKT